MTHRNYKHKFVQYNTLINPAIREDLQAIIISLAESNNKTWGMLDPKKITMNEARFENHYVSCDSANWMAQIAQVVNGYEIALNRRRK